MFTGQVSLTYFLHIGVFLGASKRPLYEQTKSFRYPEKSQNSVYRVQNAPTLCIYLHLVPNLDILGNLMAFSGALRLILGQLGSLKGLILLMKWLSGSPRRAPMGQKWASNANLVNIGQLDQYVVFGTKSGAVQDFQSGKKYHTGVKQTHAGPPKNPPDPLLTPHTPQKPSWTIPTTNVVPLVMS